MLNLAYHTPDPNRNPNPSPNLNRNPNPNRKPNPDPTSSPNPDPNPIPNPNPNANGKGILAAISAELPRFTTIIQRIQHANAAAAALPQLQQLRGLLGDILIANGEALSEATLSKIDVLYETEKVHSMTGFSSPKVPYKNCTKPVLNIMTVVGRC